MFIKLSHANGTKFFVNVEQIEYVRENANGAVTIHFGAHSEGSDRIIVEQSYDDVLDRIEDAYD